jgi:TM2 domain-containing membrane protein YozV
MYSTGLAYFLWLVSGFGALGFHRFYLGKFASGVVWLCTGGLCGIGCIWDLLTLGHQVREANYRAALKAGGTGMNPADEASYRIVNPAGKKESPERTILRLAKNSGGVISPGDLAIEADIPLEQAKSELDALVKKGFAELRVRSTGTIAYIIPDFRDKNEPFEEF